MYPAAGGAVKWHPDLRGAPAHRGARQVSQPIPSRSPSKRCGSGARTTKRRNVISPQSRSGGGGGMQTEGYAASQDAGDLRRRWSRAWLGARTSALARRAWSSLDNRQRATAAPPARARSTARSQRTFTAIHAPRTGTGPPPKVAASRRDRGRPCSGWSRPRRRSARTAHRDRWRRPVAVRPTTRRRRSPMPRRGPRRGRCRGHRGSLKERPSYSAEPRPAGQQAALPDRRHNHGLLDQDLVRACCSRRRRRRSSARRGRGRSPRAARPPPGAAPAGPRAECPAVVSPDVAGSVDASGPGGGVLPAGVATGNCGDDERREQPPSFRSMPIRPAPGSPSPRRAALRTWRSGARPR